MEKRLKYLFAIAIGIYCASKNDMMDWFIVGAASCLLLILIAASQGIKGNYGNKIFLAEFIIISICGGPITLLLTLIIGICLIIEWCKKRLSTKKVDPPKVSHAANAIDYLLAQDDVTKIEFLKVEDGKYEITVDGKYAGRHSYTKKIDNVN